MFKKITSSKYVFKMASISLLTVIASICTNAMAQSEIDQKILQNISVNEPIDLSEGMSFYKQLPYKTIMFSEQDLTILYEILSGVNSKQETAPVELVEDDSSNFDDSSSDLPDEEEMDIPSPSFFLNSMLYVSPESWTIWINDAKIRKNQELTQGDFKILNVEEGFAEILWSSLNLDIASPNWRSKVQPIDGFIRPESNNKKESRKQKMLRKIQAFRDNKFNWDYKSEDKILLIDSYMGMVKFKLKLHQSFSSSNMSVAEGRSGGSSTTSSLSGSPFSEVPMRTSSQDEEFINKILNN